MSELKPCPYCGEQVAEDVVSDVGWHFVYCTTCHAEGEADLGASGAIEKWNTRPLEEALQAKLDMAVEAMKLARYDVRINTHASLMRPILEEALKRLEENNVQR